MSHFDSMGQSNFASGKAMAARVAQLCDIDKYDSEAPGCPCQRNSYDCGVCVMAYADALAECHGNHDAACAILTPGYITQYRRRVRRGILELAGRPVY
jgi:Ulp1 family protease